LFFGHVENTYEYDDKDDEQREHNQCPQNQKNKAKKS